MAFNILEGVEHVNRQGDIGRQQGQQNYLASLSKQVYAAPAEGRNALLAEMEGVRPGAGMEYGQALTKQADSDEDRRNKMLFNMARVLVNSPEEMRAGLYKRMMPSLQGFGMSGLPTDYTPETAPLINKTAQGLVQAAAGAGERTAQMQNFEMLTKGLPPEDVERARRVELGLDPRAGYSIVQTQNGVGYWNRQAPDSGVNMLNYGGTQPGSGGTNAAPNSFGIKETDDYVRDIMGKVGNQLPAGGSAEQIAAAVLPHLINRESAGDPNAVSPKGARGLAQLMPETMRAPGFGVTPLRNDSPEENVRLGRDYLVAMLKRYRGNVPLALAAYNAGPRVADAFASPQAAAGGTVRAPERKDANNAPSGYQWTQDANGGIALAPIPGGPADPQRAKKEPTPADQMKSEMSMRKELSDRLKEPRQVLTMYQNLEKAATAPSAANDLSLIFSYMKMLDPGSVVREQEFANAQNAAGVPDQVRNMFNKLQNGERLNENQRRQFLASAAQVAGTARDQVTSLSREYQSLADQYGYDPVRSTGMADFRDVGGRGAGAQYTVGQTVQVGGQRFRVAAINPNDPEDVDLEQVP